MTNKDKITLYAELKTRVSQLEDQMKILKPDVLKEIEKKGGELKMPLGKFKISTRPRWKYSDKVVKLSEKLKIRQIEEQEQDIAVNTPSTTMTFTQVKL